MCPSFHKNFLLRMTRSRNIVCDDKHRGELKDKDQNVCKRNSFE